MLETGELPQGTEIVEVTQQPTISQFGLRRTLPDLLEEHKALKLLRRRRRVNFSSAASEFALLTTVNNERKLRRRMRLLQSLDGALAENRGDIESLVRGMLAETDPREEDLLSAWAQLSTAFPDIAETIAARVPQRNLTKEVQR